MSLVTLLSCQCILLFSLAVTKLRLDTSKLQGQLKNNANIIIESIYRTGQYHFDPPVVYLVIECRRS